MPPTPPTPSTSSSLAGNGGGGGFVKGRQNLFDKTTSWTYDDQEVALILEMWLNLQAGIRRTDIKTNLTDSL